MHISLYTQDHGWREGKDLLLPHFKSPLIVFPHGIRANLSSLAKRLMCAPGVVPFNPASDMRMGVGEAFRIMLPNIFFLQISGESLDESVLPGCIWRDELPGQPICTASTGIKDKKGASRLRAPYVQTAPSSP